MLWEFTSLTRSRRDIGHVLDFLSFPVSLLNSAPRGQCQPLGYVRLISFLNLIHAAIFLSLRVSILIRAPRGLPLVTNRQKQEGKLIRHVRSGGHGSGDSGLK